MLKRFQSKSKSSQAGGLMALLLSCGLYACGGTDTTAEPGAQEPPTAAAAEVAPTEAEATATEESLPTATNEATATEEPTVAPPTSAPPTTIPPTAVPQPPALPAGVVDRDPNLDANCADFPSPAAAQSWWDYHRSKGHGNPGGLDGDNDGDVCEQGNDGPESGANPVAPPPAAPSIACSGSKRCAEFGTQADAQAYWEACGRPGDMDRDGDGRICESLP